MRRIVAWLFLVLVFAAVPAQASPECPMCDAIDAWWAENGQICHYHGSRLGYLCDVDPECVNWNRICAGKRDELNACIQRCMAPQPQPQPDQPQAQQQSQAPELDEFERDWAELERSGLEPFPHSNSPEWCRQRRERLWNVGTMGQGQVGLAVVAKGNTMIQRCDGSISSLVKGTRIEIGDCIRNGADGRAQVYMADRDETLRAGPTVINISRNSDMCFDEFDASWGRNKGIFDLIKGSIRVFFKGWGPTSNVSVRAGVTICGVRGSEVIVRIEPSDGSVQMGVIEGHGWIGNRQSREIRYLEANQWAKDTANGLGPVQVLTRQQWDAVVAQDGLDIEEVATGLPGPGCAMAAGNWQWGNGNKFALTPDGRWTITNGNGSGNWSCAPNSYGDPELYITPDSNDWWTRAVIAPDGTRLSGVTEAGDHVTAVRVSP